MLLPFLPCTKTSTCIDSPYDNAGEDHTEILLRLGESVTREAFIYLLADTAMALEPGLSESVIQSVSRP